MYFRFLEGAIWKQGMNLCDNAKGGRFRKADPQITQITQIGS
ncbi:hypothetical protein ABI_16330 [Asticcacaulis biprosthecium C19]|uniref:Uncharacterized protein n=1 Tax=Asticcacaulis biprosthecium C19 TaxID=715226 RepID=F4QJT6_9CAUL|nr:hypothetical protein ABI_16330 [Asticcacaulis biprosthecium C19]